MGTRSPAQLYALVVGAGLVVLGIAGFFYDASFGTGEGLDRHAVIGILDVNGWENVLHIVTGAAALFVVASYRGTRLCAIALGLLYLLLALAGFVAGDTREIFSLVPVSTEDDVLHLLVGSAGVGAALASAAGASRDPRPPRACCARSP